MTIEKALIHFKNKDRFNEELENNNILDTSICFILDTKEIYTHGLFYDGSTFDPSNIEASILNIINNKQDTITDLEEIRQGAAKGATALQSYQTLKTINDESIVGSGNITISSAYSEVNHGTADTTFTLTPNVFHVWDEVASLTLTIGDETAGVVNEYTFQFTSSSSGTSLTLPSTVKWAKDEAIEIEANKIYQVSIVNNLATYLMWS